MTIRLDERLLQTMLAQGYVRRQVHPTLALEILNYTEAATYDGVWNDVTRQCRGLIRTIPFATVVARPFPKFFNHGEPNAPELDLNAEVIVTDKLDGSLGILYPVKTHSHAIATRGSFTSDQALHATEVYQSRYGGFKPHADLTYLFEIIFPANRIVVDYGDVDDLVLLAAVNTASGEPASPSLWPGPRVMELAYRTLADALQAEPRPNCEGLVVYVPATGDRVKIKQDDYVALHRILTGTNARHVWEVCAVRACHDLIGEPKHWGSFLGIDPARAAEVLTLGDDWLAGVPDEFFDWIHYIETETADKVVAVSGHAVQLAEAATPIIDRRAVYETLSHEPLVKEIMRLATADTAEQVRDARAAILLRAWREACPEPTMPFARGEDIA